MLDYPPSVDHRNEALPLAESDVVALGTIRSGRSYVSNDYGSIYSEYKFRLTTLIIDKTDRKVGPGVDVDIVRSGGVVQLNSGKVLIRGCPTESQPRIGKQYAVFLRYVPAADDFVVLAAYEVANDGVFALDSVQVHGSNFELGVYGGGAGQLLAALRGAAGAQ
ncbi:MAG TPA: hypothetical protein VKX49_32755 [Bryobacteraceae bacterium]|nr:hypothetical protein [Bryobacteraceae bacterium]